MEHRGTLSGLTTIIMPNLRIKMFLTEFNLLERKTKIML
jgi:hypothetical protein